MAAAPLSLSIHEYLRTNYKPDVDFVDGVLEKRNLGQYEHGKVQGWLFHIFTLHAEAWGVDPVVEQRIRVAGNRVRVCDIAVLRADAPHESMTLTPPLICIEVLSPEDCLSRAKLVLHDYLAMGVENIWLVDPMYRAAFQFNATGLHDTDLTQLRVSGTPIHVDLTEPFALLDRRQANTSDPR